MSTATTILAATACLVSTCWRCLVSTCSLIPVDPPPETRCRSLEEKDDRINKEENARNLTKSKGIAPKLCTGDLHGVGKLSQRVMSQTEIKRIRGGLMRMGIKNSSLNPKN